MRFLSKVSIQGMSFHRDDFVRKFRSRFEGCLKEYAKLWVVEQLGLKDMWSNEVKRLCRRTLELLDPKVTKTKGPWNRYAAAAEAYMEAASEQTKLHQGVSEFRDYTDFSSEEVRRVLTFWRDNVPDSEVLSREILERFVPEPHRSELLARIK